jgi:toxin CptA
MALHSAPTVNYPVGRSHFQACLVAGVVLVSLLAGMLWFAQVDALGWRQGAWFLSWLVCVLLAFQGWRRTAVGTLRWDGVGWCFMRDDQSVSGVLAVNLDFQFSVLLSLRPVTGSRIWLCPERHVNVQRWDDLRRAVFSRRGPHRGASKGTANDYSAEIS